MKTNRELLSIASTNLQYLNNIVFGIFLIAAIIVFIGGIIDWKPVYFLISIVSSIVAYMGYLLVSVIARIGIALSSVN
ncbi:hypothetical protein LJC00_04200 [Dysgonomonas sp. OttesenSCG-928-M03]|nr:hypothetical protein [Dysgonomonas sp. OttesenSCG-928-M03]